MNAQRSQDRTGCTAGAAELDALSLPGDYHTLDFLREPLVAVRGSDGGIRAFQYGLKRVEAEVYRGFIFVRLRAGLPGVAEMFAPYDRGLSAYRLEGLRPLDAGRSCD